MKNKCSNSRRESVKAKPGVMMSEQSSAHPGSSACDTFGLKIFSSLDVNMRFCACRAGLNLHINVCDLDS